MTNPSLLKYRLPALFVLLALIETVNLLKLAFAFGWTNHSPFGAIGAIALGLFLISSIIVLSFDLERDLRARLTAMVVFLFLVQTALICIVSFIYSLDLMPAETIALLFDTPSEVTRRVVALAEGVTLNLSAFAFWGVLAAIWRNEIEERKSQRVRLVQLDAEQTRRRAP
jgi:hypothetical protein